MRIAVFMFALAVRIAAIELTGATEVTFGDAGDYVDTARSICTQHVYPERGNLPFFRAPGVPFFIAAVTACEPSRVRAVKYALAVCDAVTVLLIYLIAKRNIVAALLAALHPFFILGVTDIRSEPLFMMLLVAAIWLVNVGRASARPAGLKPSPAGLKPGLHPAWAGVALALSALVRRRDCSASRCLRCTSGGPGGGNPRSCSSPRHS